jgi:tetratricopeptide (TPR) repeat protein
MGTLKELSAVFAFVLSAVEPNQDRTTDEIRRLIDQLDSDEIEEREQATARLKEVVHPANSDLIRAMMGPDSESALRASEVMRSALLRRAGASGVDVWQDIQAESDQLEKLARTVAELKTEEERLKCAESVKYHALALTYFNRGEFEKARMEAAKAVEAWHDNVPARKMLNDINQILVAGKPEFGARAIAEEATAFLHHGGSAPIEITKHMRDGERYGNAKMYEEAIREFENAEFKIKAMPYECKEALDLLPVIKEAIVKSKNASMLQERQREEQRRHESRTGPF